jgi:hypothetical protein
MYRHQKYYKGGFSMKSKKAIIQKSRKMEQGFAILLVLLLTISAIFGGISKTATALATEPVYEVLSPLGTAPEIKQFSLSPRPQNLKGKVVYVIDSGIFGAHIFTGKVAELLPKYIPGVKAVHKIKPSVYSTSSPELWDEVVKNADAFVYGPAGGTSGFVFGGKWSVLLEKRGVPGIYVLSKGFEQAVQLDCEKNGMPELRRVVTPMPAWETESLDKIDEIMKQIVDCLTVPLTDKEKKTGLMTKEKPPRVATKGTLAEVQKYFHKQSWTDGLPIIPPTEEAVAEMLKGTSHRPKEIVAEAMPPLGWIATVENVAVNAVMAGCKPEYMPVLLAMVEAFYKGDFKSTVVSSNSFSFMVVVNGPIAKAIGMNGALNALGPGNQANATIGRALRLFLTNLGGLTPRVTLMAAQGNASNYSFAFSENEEVSPWEPLHVSMGFKKEESVVTIFSGGWGHGGNKSSIHGLPLSLDGIIDVIGSFQLPKATVVLITPPLAKQIVEEKGFRKKDLQEYLWSSTLMSAGKFRLDGYYDTFVKPGLEKGDPSSYPSWYLTADPGKMVNVYPNPKVIYPIVVGGENYAVFQGWKMGSPSSVSVDKWR